MDIFRAEYEIRLFYSRNLIMIFCGRPRLPSTNAKLKMGTKDPRIYSRDKAKTSYLSQRSGPVGSQANYLWLNAVSKYGDLQSFYFGFGFGFVSKAETLQIA
jgi:hypothetical protein